jgi:prolipoprotein diacylglyceryltransferase
MTGVFGTLTFGFDPIVRIGDLAVRWQALGIAGAVAVALVVAAFRAGRSGRASGLPPLRRDDLLYLCLGALLGAVVGGRLFHGLAFLDVYGADPAALLDPARGSLSLLGAVLGGSLTSLYLSTLLDGAAGRWADVAAIPLLLALGLGKLAQFLGGGGQGAAWDGPWAVAFVGGRPWLSVSPGQPSHPSQVYEGLWALAGIPLMAFIASAVVARHVPGGLRQAGEWATAREDRLQEVDRGRLRFGYVFLAALCWWLVGRVVVGSTWRDDRLVGPLNAEQGMALAVLVLLLVGWLVVVAMRPWRESREERWHLGHRRYRQRG